MPRNVSELKSGGDNSYAVPPPALKSGGGGVPPPSPTNRRPWQEVSLLSHSCMKVGDVYEKVATQDYVMLD